jgi:HK97 family phage portal protein
MGIFSRKKPEQRERDIPFVYPSYGFYNPLQGPVTVNTLTSLGIPALYRCVQLIADTVASLPLKAYRHNTEIEPTPAILAQPDRTMTRHEMISSTLLSMLIHGNAFWLLGDRDALGYPRQAVLLATDAVSVRADGVLIMYHVGGQNYTSEDILHFRGLQNPGSPMGMSVLEHHRRTLGISIAGEDCASEVYNAGGLPVGVLEADVEMSKAEAEQVKNQFIAANGGRNRTPAILAGGLKYKPLSFNPKDLELIEARQYSAQQICTIFGVPAFLAGVAAPNSMTYSNVNQDSIHFARYTLRPWISRLEASLSTLLPRGQEARFTMDALLRADTITRYQGYEIAIRSGFLTPAEVRDLEDFALESDTETDTEDEMSSEVTDVQL